MLNPNTELLNYSAKGIWEQDRTSEQASVDELIKGLGSLTTNDAGGYDVLKNLLGVEDEDKSACIELNRAMLTLDGEPESLKEARLLPDAQKWIEAWEEELKTLIEMKAFT
eukprot:3580171-Rhodomonas_salina.1